MKADSKKDVDGNLMQLPEQKLKRRAFFKYAGATAATAAIVFSGCQTESVVPNNARAKADDDAVDLGSGDIGILNYAYALEQLEAAFYTMVVADATFTDTFSAEEQTILMDIKDHEVIHREFLKAALGTSAIRDLMVDFSTVNFGDRKSVLDTAKVFEDLGVAAYNGAGQLIVDVNYLLIAGKIVSVEARHASAIRDLLNPKSADFAGDDVIDANGLDRAFAPMDVLAAADPFIVDTIIATNLPTM